MILALDETDHVYDEFERHRRQTRHCGDPGPAPPVLGTTRLLRRSLCGVDSQVNIV